jgi:hypothetical protein
MGLTRLKQFVSNFPPELCLKFGIKKATVWRNYIRRGHNLAQSAKRLPWGPSGLEFQNVLPQSKLFLPEQRECEQINWRRHEHRLSSACEI